MVIIFIVTTSILLNVSFASEVSEAEADKARLNEQLRQAKDEKDAISSSKTDAQSELESLTNQVSEAENELAKIKAQLTELNNSIDQKEKEIEEEEEKIQEKDKLLKDRIVALYEAGDTTYLDVLFNSENILDFLSNYSMIQQIMETDTELINELKDAKSNLEKDKEKLEQNKKRSTNT